MFAGGGAACLLNLGLWVTGRFWCFEFTSQKTSIIVQEGVLNFLYLPDGMISSQVDFYVSPIETEIWTRYWWVETSKHQSSTNWNIPLWMLLVPCVIATIVSWRSRPDPHSHRCQFCDYDLTGNVSGVCPECGTKL
jgi:hypothetical protein